MNPLEAVMLSYTESDLCRAIVSDDGEPLALTGPYIGSGFWAQKVDGNTPKTFATVQRRARMG